MATTWCFSFNTANLKYQNKFVHSHIDALLFMSRRWLEVWCYHVAVCKIRFQPQLCKSGNLNDTGKYLLMPIFLWFHDIYHLVARPQMEVVWNGCNLSQSEWQLMLKFDLSKLTIIGMNGISRDNPYQFNLKSSRKNLNKIKESFCCKL